MAGSARYTALLDANVLYPNTLRNLLLRLAEAGLYHARWSDRITQEWSHHLLARKPDLAPRMGRLIELVNQSVPDCLVENYEYLIQTLVLPDPNDRHVLAAAIVGHADAIVTANLRDFPQDVLDRYGLEAQHPDDFVMNQLQLRPFDALEVIRGMRASLKRPPYEPTAFVDLIERQGLPQTALYLRAQAGLI
jgi:predicted nucleic acid-binding protein